LRVQDGFSQIVRLGEGLAATGRLSERAMARTIAALKQCAEKIAFHQPAGLRCIATQACRAAENGAAFLARVEAETGLRLETISPAEEARLAVAGCAALIDDQAERALIVDIGGGSTELSWVSAAGAARDPLGAHIQAWTSLPDGVVTLAERPNARWHDPHWRARTVGELTDQIVRLSAAVGAGDGACFAEGRSHLLGASGTITSLAGVHLDLPRYQRNRVDGLWMTPQDARTAAARMAALDHAGRAAHPCIGPERADLVLPGAAILEAVFRAWPAPRIRVADRGLREGVLLTLAAQHEGQA
jgi:exopolyphosphatase/guanosine-5'-triphosphate,3'-diphosphate pyrophosphatase